MFALSKLVKWGGLDGPENMISSGEAAYPSCEGDWRHGICVMGIHDLPFIIGRPQFFGNKFLAENDPLATFCLSLYLQNKQDLI